MPKIVFQKTWDEELEWDDNVGVHITHRFQHLMDSLGFLSFLAVPRYLTKDRFQPVDLPLFCDTSEMAYGAAI